MTSRIAIVGMTIVVVLLLGILSIFILQIVMGTLHIDECHVLPMLPWINIVSGSTGILLFITIPLIFLARKLEGNKLSTCLIIIVTVLSLFFIAWTIYSNVTFFKLNKQGIVQYENATNSTYCHPQLYELTKGTFITFDIFIGLATCLPLTVAAAG